MKTVDYVLIMDVDGVISSLKEKKANPAVLEYISDQLKKGKPIALNTGRSLDWITTRAGKSLINNSQTKKVLKNLIIVGEKGGTWAEFDNQGNLIENKDDSISAPDNLKNEIRDLISNQYSNSMFYDESKLTMISTEMKDGHSLEDYREKQKMLSVQLQTLLTKNNLDDKFKVDSTTIAVDVENKFVGKHFAVRKIIEWVKKKGIKPKRYIALGDSFRSDVPMAEELHSQGLSVEFVYVGKENLPVLDYPFPIKQTLAHFGNGTLEYLNTL